MQITIDIPDDIAQQLDQTQESLPRRILELVVVDAYRCGKISTAEVGQILQLPSRLATHTFLKQMGTHLNYDEAELDHDLRTLKEIRSQ